MSFRDLLAAEYERRQSANPSYSLRSFARAFGVHHATMSRILRREGPMPARSVVKLGIRLGLSAEKVASLSCAENEEAVLASVGRPAFRPDSRWIASTVGIPIDHVNVALHALLRSGRLRMVSREMWIRSEEEAI